MVELVRMECRIHPLKIGHAATLGHFEAFFKSSDVQVCEVSRDVCDRAADIRATHGFRPLDSLDLAAAVESGCHVFVTNDGRLSGFPDITVEILS